MQLYRFPARATLVLCLVLPAALRAQTIVAIEQISIAAPTKLAPWVAENASRAPLVSIPALERPADRASLPADLGRSASSTVALSAPVREKRPLTDALTLPDQSYTKRWTVGRDILESADSVLQPPPNFFPTAYAGLPTLPRNF
jgi:hypothetical protein